LIGGGREAKLRYLDASIDVISEGDHVVCAVSGTRIHLSQLRYWSVERQEPYASAQIAFERNGALPADDDLEE
jgi:hypothetical protein